MRFVLAAAAALVAAVPAQAATTVILDVPRSLYISGNDPVTGFNILGKLQYAVDLTFDPSLLVYGGGELVKGSLQIGDVTFDTGTYYYTQEDDFLRTNIASGNPASGNYYSFAGIQARGYFDFLPRRLVYRVNGVDGVLSIRDLTVKDLAAGVPEPSTWAMMIVGFGLVGGAMRRRRATLSYA